MKRNILYRFAFSKILVIVLFAILVGGLTVALANDAFACIKPSVEIPFSLSKPVGSYAFSKALQNSGIIENPFSFWLYTKHRHAESYIENFHGTIDLNSSMSYRELIQQFKNFQIS